jgi:ABC-type Fe3+-hydroxamate transport system substrate-binding protein
VAAALKDAADRVGRAVASRDPALVFVDTGFFVPPPEDSLLADLVRRAGGKNVAEDRAGDPLDACGLLRLRPEVVLRVVETEDLDNSPPPAFRRCDVDLAEVRFEALPEALVTRAGPRAGEALEEIARALHPDAFR